MSSSTKPSPEITRAAERYLEQYGDPLVMNTYLKVTVLVLAGVCIALSALTFKSQQALANMHPMIVRINDVGHAEAIDYRNFQYRPQEAENKYYLTRWAELYFSRNEFEKVYTNPADHTELKRERWTASVTYVFRENVKNNELAVNPLGLTIVRFRADQAFS
jgi:type IV secretory pathway TrbF-like protein